MVGNGTDRMKIVEKCVPLDDVLKHIESSPREDVQTASLALLNAFFIKSQKPSVNVIGMRFSVTQLRYPQAWKIASKAPNKPYGSWTVLGSFQGSLLCFV